MSVIEILSSTITKPTGKNYEQAEVAYKDEKGEIRGKKILSFANKDVWKRVLTFKPGEKYAIKSVKNDKGFWEWTEVNEPGEEPAMQPQQYNKGAASTAKATDFRSSEEIIRTTALEVASEVCIANKGAKDTVSVAQVIEMAKLFVTYIRTGEFDPFPSAQLAPGTFDDLAEDVV